MKTRKVAENTIYHVLNRGVDKRNIFLDDEDYLRFIHDLYEFNDEELVNNAVYYFHQQSKGVVNPYINGERRTRKFLVEILAFCIMPNHYHLLLRPKSESGITAFMKKINGGYANYFNKKYERRGALFEGRYKSIAITNHAHFVYIPYYIHFNPLDLTMPEWREREIKNYKKAMQSLETYRWSSFPDYTGKKNFPSVTQREFLTEFFGGPEQYKKDVIKWLKEIDIAAIKDVALEQY